MQPPWSPLPPENVESATVIVEFIPTLRKAPFISPSSWLLT